MASIKEKYESLLGGIQDTAANIELNTESNTKILTTVAAGVGVTVIAGVAVAAVVGGFFLYQERNAVISVLQGKPIRPRALNSEHWDSAFERETGKLKGGGEKIIGRIRKGGCSPHLRREVWPFLLGLYDANSTRAARETLIEERRKEYEMLRKKCSEIGKLAKQKEEEALEEAREEESAPRTTETLSNGTSSTESVPEKEGDEPEPLLQNGEASSLSCLNSERQPNGSKSKPEASSDSTSRDARVSHDTKFLLDFATWQKIIRLDAVRMNAAWIPYCTQLPVSEEEAETAAESVSLNDYVSLEPSRRHHAARLVGILEAYAVHDPEIGYCQGMSDLLSPFVALIPEDSEAFWCFESFMRKARQNFRVDEVGIRRQLDRISEILSKTEPQMFRHLQDMNAAECIFVYRMVVVLMRRELSFEQTLSLWEVVWAEDAAAAAMAAIVASVSSVGGEVVREADRGSEPSDEFLLFVIAAILRKHKKQVMACEGVDEILRLCNSLSGAVDMWPLIDEARKLLGKFRSRSSM